MVTRTRKRNIEYKRYSLFMLFVPMKQLLAVKLFREQNSHFYTSKIANDVYQFDVRCFGSFTPNVAFFKSSA